jgi:hypothetical protein
MAVAVVLPVTGQSPATGEVSAAESSTGLLDALTRVPADGSALSSLVSYVDYRAIEAAGGAVRPTSLEALLAALEDEDPAAEAWLDAIQGVSSGPSDLLAELFRGGPAWPTTAGFDFVEVDRAVHFGEPPSDGTVLVGVFRPDAVASAYEARGFMGSAAGERTLWCDTAGCDRGKEVDLTAIDPGMPFGGRLGRRQPLAAGAEDLLSSADEATVRAMLAAARGDATSLAEVPAYRALARSTAEDVTITQAMLMPGIGALSPIDLVELSGSTPEVDAAVEAQLADLPPVGSMSAVGVLGGVSGDEEVVTVALAVPDDAAAESAAAAVAERLARAPSLQEDRPLQAVLDDVGVTSVTARSLPATDEVAATAIVELRAPLEPSEARADSTIPGRLYRLFHRLVMTRDLAWLAPSTGRG